jgi:hypothetical protein
MEKEKRKKKKEAIIPRTRQRFLSSALTAVPPSFEAAERLERRSQRSKPPASVCQKEKLKIAAVKSLGTFFDVAARH